MPKIIAAIIQLRISTGLDHHLQSTQYGFRKKRGTADALQYIRRMVGKGEARQNKTLLVLLDWEKAFDKIRHEMLIDALERMNIPGRLVNLIKSMYTNPTFQVSMDGRTSEWKKQYTGIRQGCPLSPYLFIIVMSVMFHDIHNDIERKLSAKALDDFYDWEFVDVDDTMLVGKRAREINIFDCCNRENFSEA